MADIITSRQTCVIFWPGFLQPSTAAGRTRTRAANSRMIRGNLESTSHSRTRRGKDWTSQTSPNRTRGSFTTAEPEFEKLHNHSPYWWPPPVFQRQLVTGLPGPLGILASIQGYKLDLISLPACTALHTGRAESTQQDPATGGQGGAVASGKESDKAGDNGSGIIRQQALHSPKEIRDKKASGQSQVPQHLHSEETLQNGRCAHGERPVGGGGLDGFSGPQGCLLAEVHRKYLRFKWRSQT